jgi:hypothetical protein
MLEKAKGEMPGVRVRIGTLDDFAEAILAEKPDLPIVRQDLGDTWIFGIMAMPIETGIARTLRPRIGALESLDSLLNAWQVTTQSAGQTVAAAYEKSLMFGEHTWGSWLGDVHADYLYGNDWEKARAEGRYRELEATYEEHGDYIRDAAALVNPALATRLESLARAVNLPGTRIVVFNPLPWKRQDVVEVPVAATLGVSPGTLTVRDALTGRIVPSEHDGAFLRFAAADVPAMGYRTYRVGESRGADKQDAGELHADAATGLLENKFFRMEMDARRGVIASLVDKRSGKEWAVANSHYGLGQYLYERYDANQISGYLAKYGTHDSWVICKSHLPPDTQAVAVSPQGFTATAAVGAVSASVTLHAPASAHIPHAVSLTVTLYRDQPVVDLAWSIKDKKPDFWPEAGWLCLPLNIADPQFRLSRLGSTIDPAKDICRKSNIDVFCLGGGMTVQGTDGSGVGICPMDSPLVSLGYPGLLQFNTDWEPRKPEVFVNLFNNVWGCNFQQWIGGSWSSRVRLWAARGDNNEENLVTPSWETRSRCMAAMVDGVAGTLPIEQAGIELSRKGVLITAFGADPDGNKGTLLRVWEQAGVSGKITVELPEGMNVAKATPVNLRGEKTGEPIRVISGTLTLNLDAYAPASYMLEPSHTKQSYEER